MAKHYGSTFIVMRTKEDADEFLHTAGLEGDTTAKDFTFPEELSGKKTRLIMRVGKRQVVMYENPETGEQKFYRMHPAWKSHKVYEDMPDFDD